MAGFYLNTNNTCMPCLSIDNNCTLCSATTCLQCLSGTYLSDANTCSPCPANCLTCSAQDECNFCATGFFLASDRTCQACTSSCTGCLSSSVCLGCYNGNYLDVTDSECLSCPQGCTSCASPNICTACQSGYTLTDLVCTPNDDNSGSSGLPWWAILLIVIGGLVLIGVIGTHSFIQFLLSVHAAPASQIAVRVAMLSSVETRED